MSTVVVKKGTGTTRFTATALGSEFGEGREDVSRVSTVFSASS
jgi:hypothetical protein